MSVITLYFNILLYDNKGNFLNILDYIRHQPFGFKQNRIVSYTLSCNFNRLLNNSEIITFQTSIQICCILTFIIYSYAIKILRESFHLLRHKTYNPIKKRFDNIQLEKEEAAIAIVLFSFMVLIYTNLIIYYMFLISIYHILIIHSFWNDLIINFRSGHSFSVSWRLSSGRYGFDRNYFRKILLGEISF